jgi:hypothetical protein
MRGNGSFAFGVIKFIFAFAASHTPKTLFGGIYPTNTGNIVQCYSNTRGILPHGNLLLSKNEELT